ncbi:hypothetical protein JCGZ_01115 [Jatropha curcas]|uniref:RBR-type E3 ubiquitin transferase n=1 Tax=Jatropha curcas TaxID=180498 RepID=A0A067KWK4_JATCU|nr:hypothetical protein JCGZ_01115 [Jatropha curcas]
MEDPMNYHGDNSNDYDDNDASFLEGDENDDDSIKSVKPQNYKTLNQQDIRQIMEEEISNISKLLSLSKPEASFATSIGLSLNFMTSGLSMSLQFVKRCPEPYCRVAVCKDMIDSIASKEDRDKYSQWWIKSYIEESKSKKRCPGANCDHAIEFIRRVNGSFDVTRSNCFTSFCWNCVEEGHRPLDCETVKKWILKNSSESENVTYIVAYCKPCPSCKRPIGKNAGCMQMTCGVCRYEF